MLTGFGAAVYDGRAHFHREGTMGWVVLAVLVALVIWVVAIWNKLVALRNRFKNAFAQIDVQLKRRFDLIPNLVETAKGYLAHERNTLEAVIAARNQAASATQKAAGNPADAEAMQQMMVANAGLNGALGRFFALAEAYPDLKANTTMMQLSEEMTSTENKIAFARQAYNDAVMSYNTAIESVPDNFVAGFGQFKPATLLESTEAPEERKAVKVSFS
jgi:LemA protein